jgi:hypothetical protein
MSRTFKSSVLYEAYGVTIPGLPFGRALETRNFVSNLDRDHSARSRTKGLSAMLVRHLKRSYPAQPFSGH